eukprot:3539402-Pyramimonas_sp.AAC.1
MKGMRKARVNQGRNSDAALHPPGPNPPLPTLQAFVLTTGSVPAEKTSPFGPAVQARAPLRKRVAL